MKGTILLIAIAVAGLVEEAGYPFLARSMIAFACWEVIYETWWRPWRVKRRAAQRAAQ